MDTFLDDLLTSTGVETKSETAFKPVARYFVAMDSLIYLNEDLSYRADRVDTRLTLLWHPYEEKLIGIKLKGFRYMFESMRIISGIFEKKDFIPIIQYLELALFASAESIMAAHCTERKLKINDKYSKARTFLNDNNILIPSDEVADIAA